MAQYFTGKGYGISDLTDISGRPLLTYQGTGDKKPFILSDRVAQTFDFTIPQKLTAGAMKNDRLDNATASYIKGKLGGSSDDELDHKISLELGGSNAPSNLMVQHGITAGASAASDQLENSLALEVVAGRMSLLTAWRTLAEQKGFLLGEDSKIGSTFSFSEAAKVIFDTGKNFITGQRAKDIKKANATLDRQMRDDIEKLKQDPMNQPLLTRIFQTQVASVSEQLNVPQKEGAAVVKSYLGNYAQSKGVDPRELMSSLNSNIQKIIDNSSGNPGIFGVQSTTLLKLVSAVELAGGTLLGLGVVLAIIGVILVGPEVAAGAFAGGLLTAGFAALGISIPLGLGFLSFEIGGALTLLGIALNMVVKEVYDNAYLLPTQNISALKDALAVQKGLAAFLPSQQSTQPKTPTKPAIGGGVRVVGSQTGLFIGHIDQGHLQAVTPFKPQEFQNISSADDLAAAAQHNLAAYLSSLAGVLDYEIKAKAHVTLPDGTELIGNTVYIPSSVSKKGVTHYKKIQDKFAVAEVYIKTSAKGRINIEEIVLGPIDETKYQPTASDFVQLANKLDKQLITTSTQEIKAITLTPPMADISTPTTPSATLASAPATSIQPPTEAASTLLQYAHFDEQGNIIGFNINDLPKELLSFATSTGNPVLAAGVYERLIADIQNFTGLDERTVSQFIIPTITEPQRNDYFRSELSKDYLSQYGGHEKVTQTYGDFVAFGLFLINNARAKKTGQKLPAEIKPYVIFQGSPDIFDRRTGRHITSGEAMTLSIFAKGLVEHINRTRPEVKTAADFAGFAGKDLVDFPV